MTCATMTLALWLTVAGEDCLGPMYTNTYQGTPTYRDGTRIYQVTEGQYWQEDYPPWMSGVPVPLAPMP